LRDGNRSEERRRTNMLFLRFLFFLIAVGALACAAGVVFYDVYLAFELSRLLQRRPRVAQQPVAEREARALSAPPSRPLGPRRAIRWISAAKFCAFAAVSALLGM